MPLSTRRARVLMPSMLMNSVAKVGSAESLANSFRASRRASIPWDWILSSSCRAALAYREMGEIGGRAGVGLTEEGERQEGRLVVVVVVGLWEFEGGYRGHA